MTDFDALNRVIDDVARQMTGAEAAPDVRTRVLNRLDGRAPRRWRMVLVPTAVAAAIAVILLFRPAVRQSPVAADAARVPVPQQTRNEQRTQMSASIAAPSQSTGMPITNGESTVATITPSEPAIPALSALERLSIASIQPEVLEIRPLDTAPLVMPPLDDDTDER